jgi:hypothetical protein
MALSAFSRSHKPALQLRVAPSPRAVVDSGGAVPLLRPCTSSCYTQEQGGCLRTGRAPIRVPQPLFEEHSPDRPESFSRSDASALIVRRGRCVVAHGTCVSKRGGRRGGKLERGQKGEGAMGSVKWLPPRTSTSPSSPRRTISSYILARVLTTIVSHTAHEPRSTDMAVLFRSGRGAFLSAAVRLSRRFSGTTHQHRSGTRDRSRRG